jgi:uncharacterized protein (DUF58 family)
MSDTKKKKLVMTTGQRVVLILLAFSLLSGLITGAQIYYRLSYVWLLVYIGNWVWAKFSLRGIVVRRHARTLRAQLGQIFEERFDIYNDSRLPRLWLEVRDESTLPGSLASQVFTQIGGRQGRTYIARTRLIRRGVYPLGPTVLASGDLFGLFPQEQVIPADNSLLVYPMLIEIRDFPSPIGLVSGGDALRRRTPQITPNAAGVREYAPGDSLSRIHWPTTARRDMLMVKEFELDPQAEVWIFLDADMTAAHSLSWEPKIEAKSLWDPNVKIDLPPATDEYGASVAGSMARYYLRTKRAVGFVSRGDTPILLPADRGGRQLVKILEALALWKADGTLPFLGLIEAQAQHIPRGSTVILITSSIQDEITLSVDYLIRRGLRPIALLLEASSFGGPEGTPELVERLRLLNVIVRKIRCNESLAGALSTHI